VKLLLPGAVQSVATAHLHDGVLDAPAVGRALSADHVIEGAVRIGGAHARARVRIVDTTSGVQAWADRFEGPSDDPFALEDAIGDAVAAAVGERIGGARRGPKDPEVRRLFDAAHEQYALFGGSFVTKAIELLRQAQKIAPNDPWILSALGAALTRFWVTEGATDRAVIAEAEELSLRAIAADPSMGETYCTIGILRLQHGETRAAIRAFQDALARTPGLGEAHGYLGRLLGESGYADEALRRLDLAIRADPRMVWYYWERARIQVLLGDRAGSEATIERSAAVSNDVTSLLSRSRLALWWRDKELAKSIVKTLESLDNNFARIALLPVVRSLAFGESPGQFLEFFRAWVRGLGASPRARAFLFQLSVEYHVGVGEMALGIEELELAVQLPLIDLLWVDRCPVLAPLRDDPRFARCRAIVAARVAELWG
jgi:serine/threonine-protein kinase